MSNSCKVPFNVPRGTFSFFGIAFGSQQTKGFFFSSGSAQETSPACAAGKGPFVQFPVKHYPMFHVELFLRSCLWLAVGQRLISFPFGSAKAISPACLAGRGPFVQFLQSTLQCSTWNFFSSVLPLARSRPKVFSFPPARPRNQPGLSGREGAFCPIPAKYPSMFHVELFLSSVLPLAFCRPKAFFFSSGSAQETSPACLAGR